jgi:putative FmdB family regulatory protein
MPLYEYECVECGEIFDKFTSVENRNNVKHCGKRADKLICSNMYTDADMSYKFVTQIFGGKPVQIRSKTHYRDMLKQNNMPDASPGECMQEGRTKKKARAVEDSTRIRETANRLQKKMQHDNVNHVAKEAVGKLVEGGRRLKNEQR